jgi:RNA polymerase sigma-70 factor (ECF subfamily)
MEPMKEPSPSSGVCHEETESNHDDTRALLAAIRRGDPDAFDRVAREHSPRLYRLALHLTGRREDAEDLVQETLVRTLPALRRFEGRSTLSTYLVRSLTNLWKNRLRSKSRSRIVDWFSGKGRNDGEEMRETPDRPDDAPTPLERMEASDRAATVRRAITRLEPARRLCLLLREVEELSYEEIASMTGVPVGTVRSRLARAREDLRTDLGGRL